MGLKLVSPGLIIFLIIVMWLFVLAPLLLRGQRPIRRSGQAYDDTRVVYEGGSGDLPSRQGSTVVRSVRRAEVADEDDLEVVPAEQVSDQVELIEEEPGGVVEGEVVELEPTERKLADRDVADPEEVGEEAEVEDENVEGEYAGDEDVDKQGTFELDETYTDTADLMHPYARARAEADYVAEDDAEPAKEESLELTEDDVEFARARSQRGGWDPDRQAARNADIYARRQRTVAGLGIAVVVTLLLGVFVGGWTWWFAGATIALLVAYLFALRAQVKEERRLQQRRIRQLRRARLGVRESDAPANLRRPGGVVMELDDESPDFDGLETITPDWDTDLFDDTEPDFRDVS